ncbi:hypothetical protein [Mycobacterium sp. ACS4331]|uniref:hypothetical protein n=1 Tax=Mycobacterium sp. ACS4331 TaxID=1834121 RepID=UPI0007FFC300|nr:hypothetical protein [Mycobacterium sp. ACS4331]OBF11418.1 hypothetical protein A5727_20740 [Mycobacterium sp. ACS4331]
MIRAFAAAAAAAGAMLAAATAAGAQPEFDYADVPNMAHDVQLSTKCYSWERFIFGRGEGGQTYACHYIPNQWPPVDSGFWVWSPPLYGVQEIGAPCPTNRGAAAQTPDGLPLECAGPKGWQQDFYA